MLSQKFKKNQLLERESTKLQPKFLTTTTNPTALYWFVFILFCWIWLQKFGAGEVVQLINYQKRRSCLWIHELSCGRGVGGGDDSEVGADLTRWVKARWLSSLDELEIESLSFQPWYVSCFGALAVFWTSFELFLLLLLRWNLNSNLNLVQIWGINKLWFWSLNVWNRNWV